MRSPGLRMRSELPALSASCCWLREMQRALAVTLAKDVGLEQAENRFGPGGAVSSINS